MRYRSSIYSPTYQTGLTYSRSKDVYEVKMSVCQCCRQSGVGVRTAKDVVEEDRGRGVGVLRLHTRWVSITPRIHLRLHTRWVSITPRIHRCPICAEPPHATLVSSHLPFTIFKFGSSRSHSVTFSGLVLLLPVLPSHSCLYITSVQLCFVIPISRCPLTSIVLATCPNHLSLASPIFSLMFSTPALALISSVLISSIIFIPIIGLQDFNCKLTHFFVTQCFSSWGNFVSNSPPPCLSYIRTGLLYCHPCLYTPPPSHLIPCITCLFILSLPCLSSPSTLRSFSPSTLRCFSESIDAMFELYGIQKVSLLRRFYQMVGIQILLREYNLESKTKQTFYEDDIVNVFPIVKNIHPKVFLKHTSQKFNINRIVFSKNIWLRWDVPFYPDIWLSIASC